MDGAADSCHAWIALGANLPGAQGSPSATLDLAVQALQELATEPLLVSSYYHSTPKDCPPGAPVYVNAVARLQPGFDETPHGLLRKLQQIEIAHGRTRGGLRNESRTLDLDLLAFGAVVCATPDLVLPHPRAHERRFVLEPWMEIAGAKHLLAGKPLQFWLEHCADPPLVRSG